MRQMIIILLGLLLFSCKGPGAQQTPAVVAHKADTAVYKMPDSLKNKITDSIKTYVKSGFYSTEETLENVKKAFAPDSVDEQWVISHINRAYAQAFNAQVKWPQVVGFDKMAKAFDKLNQHHIIALHDEGITRDAGQNDCKELHSKLKKKGIKTKGYCFYCKQDIKGVVKNKTLEITFGDFDNNRPQALAIGKEVTKALKEQGFKVMWNNTPGAPVELADFTWRKRFGNGNCSYDRAVKILSGKR